MVLDHNVGLTADAHKVHIITEHDSLPVGLQLPSLLWQKDMPSEAANTAVPEQPSISAKSNAGRIQSKPLPAIPVSRPHMHLEACQHQGLLDICQSPSLSMKVDQLLESLV